nr:MAG TPA: hypothetical protein [Ackermannviridae sp.]DAX66581.1 MAG TPA: hypothetical protein [Bacteriophage sp.]
MDLSKELDLLKKENEALRLRIKDLQVVEDLFYWNEIQPTTRENIIMIVDSIFESHKDKYIEKVNVYRELVTEFKNKFNVDLLNKLINARNKNRTKTNNILDYICEIKYDDLFLDLIIYMYPNESKNILKYSNLLFSKEYARVCEKFIKE